jgi:hypothetical protein
MEPTPDVVGHAIRAHLPNESDERFLDEVIRGVIVANRCDSEGLELGSVGIERRFDDCAGR